MIQQRNIALHLNCKTRKLAPLPTNHPPLPKNLYHCHVGYIICRVIKKDLVKSDKVPFYGFRSPFLIDYFKNSDNVWYRKASLQACIKVSYYLQIQGHSVHNNTDHFLWSRLEKLAIMGQKLISYHIESST